MAAGASIAVIGWWTGFKIGGLLSLAICGYFEQINIENARHLIFFFLLIILMILNTFAINSRKNKKFLKQKSNILLNN